MRLALTGPEGDGGPLGEGLRALGVETVGLPLVEVAPVEDGERAFAARHPAGAAFDGVAFSSARAVDAFVAVRPRLALALGTRVLAVGPATARRAREAGLCPDPSRVVAGEGAGAAGLLDALRRPGGGGGDLRGARIVLPSSARAGTELADGLRALGALVEVLPLYTVRPLATRDRVREGLDRAAPDALLLASPSAAEALASAEGGPPGRDLPPLLALGGTTAGAMEALGLPVAGTAARPTPAGVRSVLEECGMTTRFPGRFPASRPRRLRRSATLRSLVAETRLAPDRLVAPLFVAAEVGGDGVREPVGSMPGVHRGTPEAAVEDARALWGLGVRAVLLFGIPRADGKDGEGSAAWDPEGPVCRAVAALKGALPDLQVWTDVCLCEYTDHGHCGPLDASGAVRNDAALPLLSRAAVAYARAGADAVCPSDMMDGRVGALRAALDREGFEETLLVSYAVKYASAFYGPFRDAAGSTPRQGDRRGYQMDPANAREALREAALDEAEGADVLMVKPALACLDIVRRVRDATTLPVAAYNVSGEYAMLHAAAERGWIDGDRAILETLLSIRRAGADLVVTYHAKEAARLLA